MLTKRRILELYLNTVDYGMGQHGIKAASAYYFHKTPAQLSLRESSILVGLVPNPPQKNVYLDQLVMGQQTALSRSVFFSPERYSQLDIQVANRIPLDQVVYPFKDAWDRGATSDIPAVWHGVGFYSFADPTERNPVQHVSSYLKLSLAAFLDEARARFHLTGVDHLGVYNDRPMRGSQTALSAHAYGQAIDISGFRFADGQNVKVQNHVDTHTLARLKLMEDLLKLNFPIVVDCVTIHYGTKLTFTAKSKGQDLNGLPDALLSSDVMNMARSAELIIMALSYQNALWGVSTALPTVCDS